MKYTKDLLITITCAGLTAVIVNLPAAAFTLTYQGDTTGEPTWLRTSPGSPPSHISGQNRGEVGQIVPYNVLQFVVTQSGLYSFTSAVPEATSALDGTWDNFLVLYQDNFNPTDQLTNALVAGNVPNNGSLAFNQYLVANNNYFLVTTGRQTKDFGQFTNTITGSGNIEVVSEPITLLGSMTAIALGTGFKRHRRKNQLE